MEVFEIELRAQVFLSLPSHLQNLQSAQHVGQSLSWVTHVPNNFFPGKITSVPGKIFKHLPCPGPFTEFENYALREDSQGISILFSNHKRILGKKVISH